MNTTHRDLVVFLLLWNASVMANEVRTITSIDDSLIEFTENWTVSSHHVSGKYPQTVTASIRQVHGEMTGSISLRYFPGIRAIRQDKEKMDSILLDEIGNAIAKLSANSPPIRVATKDQKWLDFRGVRARYVLVGPSGKGNGAFRELFRGRAKMIDRSYLAFILRTSVILLQLNDVNGAPFSSLDECLARITQ